MQNLPWSVARKHLEGRKISVNGILCVDEGRRVVAGDVIELRLQPLPPPPGDNDVRILHLDEHLVVVDKPAGMLSLRHPGDLNWRQERKDLQPSLEECLSRLISRRRVAGSSHQSQELLAVHRIDRETSGILVFARTEEAQKGLIGQFAAHTAMRKYLCLIPGTMSVQTIVSYQVRDRGDGLRGSSDRPADGQKMVTHIRPLRQLGEYSELECRLETGRTNQIRIHLAEKNHPICGDVKYRGPFGQPPVPDLSKAPRLALHATQLGFVHPVTHEVHDYQLAWPKDIQSLIRRLSASGVEVTEPSQEKNKKRRC
ncbi:MAG: RluA family pseudouridine synthase [Planctomycetaceae bacterium]